MPRPIFISYARGDVESPRFRDTFVQFLEDLKARVSNRLPLVESEELQFVDGDIALGEDWNERIFNEVSQSKVGVLLLSPRYFTRRACGQELQVLLQRHIIGANPPGIIPVLWETFVGKIPACVERFQNNEGKFPPEYARRGMRSLTSLQAICQLSYHDTMELLASRIATAADSECMKPLPPDLDFTKINSVWEDATASDPESHKQGGISKTCFVFLSKAGWDWIPYQDGSEKIGALAQKITGELGLRYEELPCDATLPQKLADTSERDVPTIIFGDPTSLEVDRFALYLKAYDGSFLPNCAALVPWSPETRGAIDADPRWAKLRKLKKVKNPPPFHEWRSIFSFSELDKKTRAHIEQIRSQLLKQLISDPENPVTVARAEDETLERSAAALGIDTQSTPQLGPGR